MHQEYFVMKNQNIGKYVTNIVWKNGKVSYLQFIEPNLALIAATPLTYASKEEVQKEINTVWENMKQNPKFDKKDLKPVKLVIEEQRTEEQVRKDISNSKL